MIPNNIKKDHIISAIEELDKIGIKSKRNSTIYDLIYNGKSYPPKLVISLANKFANGTELDPSSFHSGPSSRTFDLLRKEGFEIIKKNDPILDLIEGYKQKVRSTKLVDELYKWELLVQFNGRPDTNALDFFQEIKDVKFSNLIYQLSSAVIIHIAREKPEELRQLFIKLFDESIDLKERVQFFNIESLKLYRSIGETRPHHQDERTIATYLTFRFPHKYTFYKNGFYKKYCQLLNIDEAKKNEKYIHYLELIDDLTDNYIKEDEELIELIKSIIPDYYDGVNHKLLAQDILYQMLDKKEDINYWIFQGNPKVFDVEASLTNELLSDWTVSAHKDKIKVGDKVILWITGNKSGCYALAEVMSEPHSRSASNDDHLWKKEDTSDFKADIKITHNLVDSPITKDDIIGIEELKDMKIGNQGTNFVATKEEYEKMLELAESKSKGKQYWLYSPGENAYLWDEFYNEGIMALGWDELGDLSQFKSREELKNALDKAYGGDSSKSNDVTANDEFVNKMKIGDVIIVKKGRKELVGYGVVASDYKYDSHRVNYNHVRKVEWQLKGNWKVDFNLVVKTLTDITKYESDDTQYNTYYERLLGIMETNKDTSGFKVKTQKINYPLNTIFYGPPGTGKTYNTILRAAEIIENRKIDSYNEAKQIFKDNLHSQIEFITFHQNYSYEDFIQGLRPDTEHSENLTFEKKDGIFFKIATDALFEYYKTSKNVKENNQKNNIKKDENEVFLDFVDYLKNLDSKEFKSATGSTISITSFSKNNNIEFKHANSSRTYLVSANRLLKLFNIYPDINKINNVHTDIIEAIGGCNSTVYWVALREFIKFYNNYQIPTEIENEELFEEISYESKRKFLSTMNLDDLKINSTEDIKNYVIIIDEINRANISRVFGELITLIEPDKRSHGEIPLIATLPSGDSFVVPSNLYIIGTMNTADKSIALLDIALRRRFEFEPMYPKYEIEGKEIYHVETLQKINEQIKNNKGHDFQIGHSYFMSESGLTKIMNFKVIPLLLEYYMNDEKEVNKILQNAGLKVDNNVWPLRIVENDD